MLREQVISEWTGLKEQIALLPSNYQLGHYLKSLGITSLEPKLTFAKFMEEIITKHKLYEKEISDCHKSYQAKIKKAARWSEIRLKKSTLRAAEISEGFNNKKLMLQDEEVIKLTDLWLILDFYLSPSPQFGCSYCDFVTYQQTEIEQHVEEEHPEEWDYLYIIEPNIEEVD